MDDKQNMNNGIEDEPHAPPEMRSDSEHTPSMPSQTSQTQTVTVPASESRSYGPIVGIIIIVILLVLAGFYFWGSTLGSEYEVPTDAILEDTDIGVVETTTVESGGAMVDESTGTLLGSSDEIADLEVELDGTLLDEIDAELESIDAELNF